jgi:hypothetical protein
MKPKQKRLWMRQKQKLADAKLAEQQVPAKKPTPVVEKPAPIIKEAPPVEEPVAVEKPVVAEEAKPKAKPKKARRTRAKKSSK